jgi:hypothetical protein
MNTKLICFVVLVSMVVPALSTAATFNVNTVSGFQNALNTAAANGVNDTINVAAGTYTITTTLTFSSTENKALTVIGAGTGSTVLDGGNTTRLLSLETTEPSAALSIKKVTFRNGKSGGNGGGLDIQTAAASITIENSEFNDNSATILGGGVNAVSNTGTVTISNCSFRRNSGLDDAGGLNVGTTDGIIVLTNSIFEDNTVPGVHPGVPAKDGGGAILYVDGSGQITMTGNTFNRNSAADGGGGVMTYLLGAGVSLTINNNTFSNNRAQLDGGGCFTRINDSGTITYNNNHFSGNTTVTAGGAGTMIHLNAGTLNYAGNTYTANTAGEDGAGAWIWNGTGTMTITGNTYTGNQATNNGGGAMISADQGTVIFTKNIFNANSAGNVGGGLSYATANGQLNFSNNTFYGNGAPDGGALYLYFDQAGAHSTIFNNILWHDTPNGLSQSGAVTATATYSDIENGTAEPWFGTGCINKDPLFMNAGGGDFHLRWDHFPTPDATKSPCIDTGDPASAHDPDGTRADMGALPFNQSTGEQEGSPVTSTALGLDRTMVGGGKEHFTIRYSVVRSSPVTVKIYDRNGQLVETLVAGDKPAGSYEIVWNSKGVSAGIYFCRFETASFQVTEKLIVLK